MTHAVRHAALIMLLALGLALALNATQAPQASAAVAEAAKLKKCKPGWNAKKCRCPATKKRVKRDGRYRCKKKAAARSPQQTDGGVTTTTPNPQTDGTNTGTDQGAGGTNPGTTDPGTTDPGAGGETPPPPTTPAQQFYRDDAAYDTALRGTLLRKWVQGSQGYYFYAWHFRADHVLLYCSYYYSATTSQTVTTNRSGTWSVNQGFTNNMNAGVIGKVQIAGTGFSGEIGVEMLGNQANVQTNSTSWEQGAFGRMTGTSYNSCSAVPDS